MNAIGYVRISKKDQSKWSLGSQEKYIRDYCARNKVNVLAMFIDDGKKSYTFDRPDYQALERFITQHKGLAQYLVILDHDRFSRNLPEALLKIEYLERKHDLKVLSTDEPIDLDTQDPMVFMQRAFKYMMANHELITIRKRARIGVRQAKESGRFVNQAPFGYKNGKDASGKSLITIDETKAYIIQKIFRDYLSGIPHYIIYKNVKKLGFPLTGRDAIVRVLNNATYAGLIRINASKTTPERIITGVHEAIVPEIQFWRAQELLGKHKRKEKVQPRDDFPLRGVLTCTCGTSMTAGYSKGKKQYYLYYRCLKHGNVNIPGKVIHGQLAELMQFFSFTQEQVDHICETAQRTLEAAQVIRAKQAEEKKAQLKEVKDKIERLEERLMEDEIEPDTYKKYFRKFQAEKALLTEEISSLGELVSEKLKKQLEILPRLVDLPAIYEKANLNQKHSLLCGVFKYGLSYKEGAFRTPYVNPAFRHKMLKINKKGLLFVEQSLVKPGTIPSCAGEGTRTPTP